MTPSAAEPTFYQILQVHQDAPTDLISAVYWRLTGRAQAERGSQREAGIALYHLTKAYETLADVNARAAYDRTLGIKGRKAVPDFPRRRRGVSRSLPGGARGAKQNATADPYELLRLDPAADPAVVAEAYGIMRLHYTRLVPKERDQEDILVALHQAFEWLSDPDKRTQYDQMRARQQASHVQQRPDSAASDTIDDAHSEASRHLENPASVSARTENRRSGPAAAEREATDAIAAPYAVANRGDATDSTGSGRWNVKGIAHRLRKSLNADQREDRGGSDAEEVFLDRLSAVSMRRDSRDESGPTELLARLTVVNGPNTRTSFEMNSASFTIGAAQSCDACLPDLADLHARLLYRDGNFVLFNLTEEVPAIVHGDAGDWAVLESGDTFELGPHRLQFDSLTPETVSS